MNYTTLHYYWYQFQVFYCTLKLIHVCFYLTSQRPKLPPPCGKGAWSTARQRNPPDEHNLPNIRFHGRLAGRLDYKPLKWLKCVWFMKHSLKLYTKGHTFCEIYWEHLWLQFFCDTEKMLHAPVHFPTFNMYQYFGLFDSIAVIIARPCPPFVFRSEIGYEHRGTTMANNGTLEMQSATGWHKPTKRQMVTSCQIHTKMTSVPCACLCVVKITLFRNIPAYTHCNRYNAQHLQLFHVKNSVRHVYHIWYLPVGCNRGRWRFISKTHERIHIRLACGDRNAPNISWHLIPESLSIKTSFATLFQQISSSCLCSKCIQTSKSPALSNEYHKLREKWALHNFQWIVLICFDVFSIKATWHYTRVLYLMFVPH